MVSGADVLMSNRYFHIPTKTELFMATPALIKTGLIHLIYDSNNPDHAMIDESNPFFSPLPDGQQLTFDINGIPNGLEPIPAPVYTAQEQALIDLQAAGVTAAVLTVARYLDSEGDGVALTAVQSLITGIAINNSLTDLEVAALIQ